MASVPVCSASELQRLAPGDVVTKLKLLLCLLIGLFSTSHAVAFAGHRWDEWDRRRVLSQVMSLSCGFRQMDGAWTWALALEDIAGDRIGAVRGTLIEAAAALIGLPPARLLLALPHSLLRQPAGGGVRGGRPPPPQGRSQAR